MPATKASRDGAATMQLKPQSFITALVRDPAKPPRLRAISGYIGASSEKGHTRVYLDVELRRYVDVPSNSILHSVPDSGSPLGGVHIWVEEKTPIRHHGNWAGSEDPTTMATGEEGGDPPTTMATGEEGGGLANPWLPVINPNPFGRF